MQKGDKGENVKMLQHAVLDCGAGLPRWGVDGDLGEETLAAVAVICKTHGRSFDPDHNEVTEDEAEFIFALRDLLKTRVPLPTQYVDRRKHATRTHDYGARPWNGVTGICLHQTACNMGEYDARYDAIGAHFVVTRGGKILHMHDIDRLIVHGNGWNTMAVGIEFDGLYAGIEGDPSTVWDDPSTAKRETGQSLTPEAISSGQQLLRWICDEVKRHEGLVKYLVAHRQASANRRSDPGSAIWQQVAIPMQEQLDLTDGGIGLKVGNGYAIPEAWDPRCKGIKY